MSRQEEEGYGVVISHLISRTTSICPGDDDGAALDLGKSKTTTLYLHDKIIDKSVNIYHYYDTSTITTALVGLCFNFALIRISVIRNDYCAKTVLLNTKS